MGATTIQWCDHSINPFKARNRETGKVGHFCVKLSAGCKQCYSSRMQNPFLTQLEFVATNRPKVELFLDGYALDEVLRRRRPTKYFWCDMTDMFLEDYPDEWIAQCFAVMALTHWHTHLVLTKRTSRLRDLMKSEEFRDLVSSWIDITAMECCDPNDRRSDDLRATAPDVHETWPLPNIWLGTSCENQATADERISLLADAPAAVRFISYEPALEAVDFLYPKTLYPNGPPMCCSGQDCGCMGKPVEPPLIYGISWLIIGGESGPGARPFGLEWARSAIRDCSHAGVKPFVKQLGKFPFARHVIESPSSQSWTGPKLKDRKGGDWSDPNFPEDLKIREFPEVSA